MTSKDETAVVDEDGQSGTPFSMTLTDGFTQWLADTGSSLAFTTYQAGKVFLIGSNTEDGRVSVFERSFPRCMGFGVDPEDGSRTLWLSSLYQIWRFENFLLPGQEQDGYDAVFVPIEGRTTGEVDVHDIHTRESAEPVFVVTRFNCLATLDRENSFKPIWKPPFISEIAPEDRCHLNGLSMRDGKPGYVTCVSDSDVKRGWHDKRRDGGLVIDVGANEIVTRGLSMPHSPRLYRGTLYVIQTGTGEFGSIDLKTGAFEPMCFLPGFARGVAFFGDHAVIGVSRPRQNKTFEGLVLNDRLESGNLDATCMIAVVNLKTGSIDHSITLEGVVQELYDVAMIRGVKRGQLIGFRKPEVRFMVKPGPLEST